MVCADRREGGARAGSSPEPVPELCTQGEYLLYLFRALDTHSFPA